MVTPAIIADCTKISSALLRSDFLLSASKTLSMNANEVIANRAIEFRGCKPGEYELIHPLNDVSRSQSTNDVYPTALRLALIFELQQLIDSMTDLQSSYQRKAEEFMMIIKMARTQLQDAVPITLALS